MKKIKPGALSFMTSVRKVELLETFIINCITTCIPADRAIRYMQGMSDNDDLFRCDDEQPLIAFINSMTFDETVEMLQKILPELIKDDLGAKEVTIVW